MSEWESVIKRTDKSIKEYKLLDHLYDINEVGLISDGAKSILSGKTMKRTVDSEGSNGIELSAL